MPNAPAGVRRVVPLVLLLALVGAATLTFRVSDVGLAAEWKTLDWRFRNFSDARRADPRLALVMIDQGSLDRFEKDGVYWPWPRSLYGAALDFLNAAGAKTVVFDLLFTSPSAIGTDQDRELAAAMRRFGNVVSAMETSPDADPRRPATLPERFALGASRVPATMRGAAHPPIPGLLAASAALGDVAARPDLDGVFRRVHLAVRIGSRAYPTMPAAAAIAATGKSLDELAPPTRDPHGRMRIRFHGHALGRDERKRTYPVYPIGNLILSWQEMQEGRRPALDPLLFKDKVVFIGASASGLLDNRPSPVSPVFPGTEIIAAAADNLINRDFLLPAPRWAGALLVALALLAAGLASRLARGVLIALALVGLASAALAGVSIAAFRGGSHVDLVAPQFALWLGFGAASAWGFAVEGRRSRFIQGAFGHYLSPEIVRRIAESPDSLQLGGERREVTFYFSDIAGFTSFSEKLDPESLTKLMNAYLGEMTETVLETGGTLDKYIGDAVMAFWGAPLPVENHALVACKAALENQRKLARLREAWTARGWPPVRNRIGLNTGPAIIGNMGSAKRFSYTAIGDNVNLASRLEGANKPYGTGIMISESTRRAAGEAIEVRELDYVKVKGKSQPIRVYELLGLKGEVEPRALEKARRFEGALAALRGGRLDEAAAGFRALAAEFDDEASKLYLERCAELRAAPPPEGWDGSFALTEK